MTNNVTQPSAVIERQHVVEQNRRETLELDNLEVSIAERRMGLATKQIENDVSRLDMIERYRNFAIAHLPDPRLQEHITNLIANRKVTSSTDA